MTELPNEPEVFFEMRWRHRNWRSVIGIVAFGFFAVLILGMVANAVIDGQNLWKDNKWIVTLFISAIGFFLAFVAVVFARRVILNREEISRIDSNGVTVAGRTWSWEQMRFIRPWRDGLGRINLTIALKRGLDRSFWVGRPLTEQEYEQLNLRLLPFLQTHYPELIE